MKSAYELAMERLEKQSPSANLSESQKERIAEIESIAKAKIAEKELFLREQITKAQFAGELEAVVQLEQQLARETRRIQEDADLKKEAVRSSQP
ncbi:MAG: hypothetical protein RLZZ244_2195 [Verrucomicrobiota bacterium]|jgi:hypothetical protein